MAEEAPKEEKPVLAEYELGDSQFDPAIDLPPAKTPDPQPAAADASLPAPAEPAAPKHSGRLVRMARDLGLSDEEINSTPTEQLDDIVYHLNRQALQSAREASRTETFHQSQDRRAAPQEEPVAPEAPDEYGLDLDESQYAPGLVRALKEVAGKSKREIEALQKQVRSLEEREKNRQQESVTRQLDRLFEKADKPTLFGKGGRHELAAEGPEYMRRIAVLSAMDRMKEGTLAEKFQRAVTMLYGQAPQPSEPANGNQLSDQQKRWNDAALAKPTQRQSEEPKGEAKALKSAARYMRENGIGDADDMTEEGFLD